jgi:protoporphyrinogen oxidase
VRHKVRHIDWRGGSIRAVVAETPDGSVHFPTDHVISSMPLRSMVHALAPEVDTGARAAADDLRYRDFLVVVLILDRTNLFPDNWLYVHTTDVKVGRIQNFNNWSAAMVPDPRYTCLCFEYFCFEGDELWASGDKDLIALATRELAQLALAPRAKVIDGTVARVPKAYPVYDAGYRDRIERIRQTIDPITNLHTVGRNGMHKYNNQDHSMLTAMMTIWNMQGAAHDVWAVNTDFEYHETLRLRPTLSDARALAS